jgi:hypothetical protein
MFPEGLSQLLGVSVAATQLNNTNLFTKLGFYGIVRNFETLICRVLYQAVESEINNTCKEKWNEPCLKRILEWNKKVLAPWTAAIYAAGVINRVHFIPSLIYCRSRASKNISLCW